MIRPNPGEVITVVLITGEDIIGTVQRAYADGSFCLEKVKSIGLADNGMVLLDKFQFYAATEDYTFPPHAILTVNKPIVELEQFYLNNEQDGTPRQLVIDPSTTSFH
jgi:hypothetical protein